MKHSDTKAVVYAKVNFVGSFTPLMTSDSPSCIQSRFLGFHSQRKS